ncbi:MAG: S41 family peptidase [Bacteroides sp.]|nr:S41 family peptidase [Roseburia sp.]MCM1347426.1 S41 family peptidase [Bacteroides sp.]MCM1421895.1 S41 family peptidase [Bacteroides sp.]
MSLKKYMPIACLVVSMLLAGSCGEDRTYEYEAKTERGHWMMDTMQDWYLWGDSLTEPAWKDFFAAPADFFSKLTAMSKMNDKWSYCGIDTISVDNHERGQFNHIDSYGMDFVVMTDPTGSTTRSYARVTSVLSGSPAAECGVRRNDFIGSIDGVKLTANNATSLKNGKSRTIEISRIGTNEEEDGLIWVSNAEVELPASRYVEDHAFPLDTVYDMGGLRIGYIMCTRLLPHAPEKGTDADDYLADMERVFSSMKAMSPDELIIDLRLCNAGTLEMACRMASFILLSEYLGDVFVSTFWNKRHEERNSQVRYDNTLSGSTLGMKRVFVITSGYTTGAAEWFVHSLRTTLGEDNVPVVGTSTAGQNVMTYTIPSSYQFTLNPVVAYVADSEGDYDYASGLLPDMEVNEFEYVDLYPYGDLRETLLSSAVEFIYGVRE